MINWKLDVKDLITQVFHIIRPLPIYFVPFGALHMHQKGFMPIASGDINIKTYISDNQKFTFFSSFEGLSNMVYTYCTSPDFLLIHIRIYSCSLAKHVFKFWQNDPKIKFMYWSDGETRWTSTQNLLGCLKQCYHVDFWFERK